MSWEKGKAAKDVQSSLEIKNLDPKTKANSHKSSNRNSKSMDEPFVETPALEHGLVVEPVQGNPLDFQDGSTARFGRRACCLKTRSSHCVSAPESDTARRSNREKKKGRLDTELCRESRRSLETAAIYKARSLCLSSEDAARVRKALHLPQCVRRRAHLTLETGRRRCVGLRTIRECSQFATGHVLESSALKSPHRAAGKRPRYE